MPRSAMPSFTAGAVALAFVFSFVPARAGDHWGAVSIAPDGGFGGGADHYTQAEAEDGAKQGCRASSNRPADCIVSAVEPDRSAVAWHCTGGETTEGVAFITIIAGADPDDHRNDMERLAAEHGYAPGQCHAKIFVTGRSGIRLTDGKKFGWY